MSDVIILNGLAWDKENLSVNGKTYFTCQEAIEESSKLGKRLPTKHEFDALLQLPHTFDNVKRGMWFAEKKEDLKSERSLFFPAAGYRGTGSTTMYYVGTYGNYWSARPYRTTTSYCLLFGSTAAITNSANRNCGFTVRCVSTINEKETMKENQEIELKIPEGYVIDSIKSTKNKIVCKPIVIKYPKSWEDAFWEKPISGINIHLCGIIMRRSTTDGRCVFKTEKQAASALAYAQLTQLMELPCYNGDWVPNWDDPNQTRCCIARVKHEITKSDFGGYFYFLAFKSEKVRDAFFDNHIDLIKQFYQL